jgi:probable DNA repair protein
LAQHILLNPTQEHSLWSALIAADREVSGLRSPDVLADLAVRAWHLLWLHNGRSQLSAAAHSTDNRAFQRLSEQFERLCTRELYLTRAQLPAAIEEALARGDLDLPNPGVVLVDFDAHTPAVASLFNSIEQAGYPVESLQTEVVSKASLQAAVDDPNELRGAALWSRNLLAQNPHTRIAIVVPNLADRRSEIERAFAQALPPETFEFSLGRPLAETSFAAAALDLLRWALEPLSLDRITALLLSPYFGAIAPEPTAEFDAYDIRQEDLLRPELSLDGIIDILRSSDLKPRLAQLHVRLRALRKSAASLSVDQPQTHAHWADAFRTVLESVTRAAHPDSLAFQAQHRWESALDSLSTLDFNSVRLTASDALGTLRRIATQTIFAPESANAPIQILGPLELGGRPFDALWFLSADDLTWPSTPAPNPLLPWQLQRALAMPGADTTRDTELAQTLTNRIARSAEQVIFSYAAHGEDGPRRVSPLLRSLHLADSILEGQPAHEPLPIEIFRDAEPLPALPPTTFRGGAEVLALQAACGFRAFAERRLYSTELDAGETGLDPRDRGNLVHKVMQAFWDALKSQQALRALTLHDRHVLLDRCIEQALSKTERQVRAPWDAAYVDVQRRRLRNLLRPWLIKELDRPTFEVLATEQEAKAVTIGPLTLNVRVDRVDQTAAGTLILDYKTGTAQPKDWLDERPDAPQLPLYAVLSNPLPAGVAFAILRAGEDLELKGFADTPAVFGKPSKMPQPSLAAQLEDWHRILEELALAFANGNAAPLPKSYPMTCKYCAQRILCRLNPSTLDEFGDDEDDFPGTPEDFTRG